LIGVQNIYYSVVEISSRWLTVLGLACISTVLHLLCVNLTHSAAEAGEYKFILVSRMLTLRDLILSNVHTFGFKMDFTFLTSVWQT